MADYETVYEATIKNVENIKTLFNGAMMTLIFLVMFALLMGILVDLSATTILGGLVILSLLIQGAFLILVNVKVPPDPVWSDQGLRSPLWDQLKYVFPVSVLFALVIGPAVFLFTTLPLPIKVAAAVTPLFLPGWMAGQEEAQVKRRDDNYPAFLRSLGSSTAARGGDERAVLKHLRHHDFGPLTDNVRDLFTRLQLRADDEMAWEHFTTESGSRLVERFTQMYEEAIEAGGRADQAGSIISQNMVRIVGLRKLRYQEASTFRGMLYGIAAGTAFALFVGLGVLDMLSGLFTDIGDVEGAPVSVPSLISVEQINMPILEAMGLVILLGNAAMSSFLVRIVDGGTPIRGLQDFTVLVWISHVTAWGSGNLMSSFVGGSVSL